MRSASESTDSCVILLPGIPYNPEKEYSFVENLSSEQYDIFLIHYDGTWGSTGKFLANNPKVSVEDFIEAICSGKITNTNGEIYKKISVIGTSFGGGLALTLSNHKSLKAVCSLSPVISYTTVTEIETLGQYLKDSCANYYDFEMSDMDELISDNIIAPETQFTLPAEKVLIFAGIDDEQIPLNDIKKFSKQHSLTLKVCPAGHITFSKVTEDIYKMIVDLLN